MPLPVLERAREELTSFRGSGMSIMEMSHRSDIFAEVLNEAEQRLRRLIGVPEEYRVLFMQGGATLHFSLVPMNLLRSGGRGDYVITGAWSEKAYKEAKKIGDVRTILSTKETDFTTVPGEAEISCGSDSDYLHYCSNETIGGVEFPYDLAATGVPVICDASSNILSKPIDINKYAMIYAGAQKNIGPSGVTVVIIRNDLIERINPGLPAVLDYRNFAENGSMPNTPNTWAIYLIAAVCEWLEGVGGIEAITELNRRKSELIYRAIDSSDGFYTGYAARAARSRMNVTFRLPDSTLDRQFCDEAHAEGLSGLRGHRTFGGVRASIYNAFPLEGVHTLVEFMQNFMMRNG